MHPYVSPIGEMWITPNRLPTPETDFLSERLDAGVLKGTTGLLLIALAIGTLLRFYGLTDRGLFDYDEAWYLLEAKSVYDAGSFLIDRAFGEHDGQPIGPAIRDYLRARGTVPHTSFKPGHVAVVLASFLVFGLHDYSPFLFSAIFGIGTAILLYFLGRTFASRREALFSSALLACSASQIPYSRSSYAQADSVFFVVLGVWLWARSRQEERLKPIVLAGAALGFAVTCHYNTAFVPFCIVALDLISRGLQFRRISVLLPRAAAWGTGIAAAPLLFEGPGQLAKGLALVPEDFLTYVEQYTNRNTGGMASSLRWTTEGFPYVLDHFLATEGIAVILVGMIGLAVVSLRLRRQPIETVLLLVLGVLPALGWLFAMKEVDVRFRTFPVTFPFLALIGGAGCAWLVDQAGRLSIRRSVLTTALVFFLCINGAIRAYPIVTLESGYREATNELLDYVANEGGTIGFRPGSSWPIYYFYLSSAYDRLHVDVRSRIDFYRQKDQILPAGDFEPVDMWRYWRGFRMRGGQHLVSHLEQLRTSGTPIVRVPNPITDMPRHFREAMGDSARNCFDRILEIPESNTIQFYDLRSQTGQQVVTWNPEDR